MLKDVDFPKDTPLRQVLCRSKKPAGGEAVMRLALESVPSRLNPLSRMSLDISTSPGTDFHWFL